MIILVLRRDQDDKLPRAGARLDQKFITKLPRATSILRAPISFLRRKMRLRRILRPIRGLAPKNEKSERVKLKIR